MADKGTSGPGLKVIANGRTSPNTEAYDENTIHKVGIPLFTVVNDQLRACYFV